MATAAAIVGSTAFKVGAAAVTAGAAVYGTVEGKRQATAARREQRTAANLEVEKAAVQNARARRRAAAQAQAAQAQVQAREASLAGTSSGAATAQGAITSQTAGNMSFQQQLASLSNRQIGALNSASGYQAAGAEAQALGALPSQLFGTPGEFLGQLGSTPKQPTPTRNISLQPGQMFT